MDRAKHSIKNSLWGFAYRFLHLFFPVLFRAAIIRNLGIAYIGLDGLFKSILHVLNLSELGFGSAVIYMMYKPIAEGDEETVNRLLSLLRKVYRIVGLVMLVAGVAVVPFLNVLVKNDTGADVNIYLLYGMYLFHTVMSYWMYSYKSILFSAHQEYEINYKIMVGCGLVQYAIQIVVLFTLRNYYIYLLVFALMIIPQNLLYRFISEKKYPRLHCEGSPTAEEKAIIKVKIGSLLGHRIGNTVIFSIDSIIISAFIGITILEKYDSYNYIMTALVTLLTVIRTSMLASVGNKISMDSIASVYKLFKRLSFLWIGLVAWVTACLLSLYQPFIEIWIGAEYLFPIGIVICIALYFFVWQFRQLGLIFKDAAGLWEKDRFKPYIGMTANVVFSILFVKITGSILGVLIPTMFILVFLYFPWELHVLFHELFKRSGREYVMLLIRFVLSSLLSVFIVFIINYRISLKGVVGIIVKGVICTIIMPIIYTGLNMNTIEFQESRMLALRYLRRLRLFGGENRE